MSRSNAREKILVAGLDTLHRRGFNATSVQDITEAAGVPKGSFYNHFPSKEGLGAAVVQRYVESTGPWSDALRETALDPRVRLEKYFRRLNAAAIEAGFSCGCLLGNLSAEISGQSPLIRENLSAVFSAWSKMVAVVVAEAQENGSVSRDLPASTLADFLIDSWEGSLLRAKADQSALPLERFLSVAFSKILK